MNQGTHILYKYTTDLKDRYINYPSTRISLGECLKIFAKLHNLQQGLKMLAKLSRSRSYWLLLLLTVIAMEAVALYFQYVLDYGPCVLCIHIRVALALLIPVCLLGMLATKTKLGRIFCHFSSFIISTALIERSWQLLGIEQGFIEGSCSMESGLPSWLSFERWWPEVFEIWEACGYTPELLFGITMAESLIAFSALFLVLSALLTLTSLFNREQPRW